MCHQRWIQLFMHQGVYQDQTASIMIYGSMVQNFCGNLSSNGPDCRVRQKARQTDRMFVRWGKKEYSLTKVKYTLSTLQIYLKYTSTCWITEEEVYFKSILFRQKKFIWSTFCEIKSVYIFNVNLKYTLIIVKMYFPGLCCKYTLSILSVNFNCTSEVYFKYTLQKNHGHFIEFICLSGPLYRFSSIVCRQQCHCEDLLLNHQFPRNPCYSLDWHLKDESWGSFSAIFWFWTWDLWFGRSAP